MLIRIFDALCKPTNNNNNNNNNNKKDLTANAWVGHPYFYIIDNSTEFKSKLARVVNTLIARFDDQSKISLETLNFVSKRKFLVEHSPDVSARQLTNK